MGTKLSIKISLVRQISSVMPDRIGIRTSVRTRQYNTIVNENVIAQSSTATHY